MESGCGAIVLSSTVKADDDIPLGLGNYMYILEFDTLM